VNVAEARKGFCNSWGYDDLECGVFGAHGSSRESPTFVPTYPFKIHFFHIFVAGV